MSLKVNPIAGLNSFEVPLHAALSTEAQASQISDDPIWNHNVSVLYSHCGKTLELKGEYLFVKAPVIQATTETTASGILNYFGFSKNNTAKSTSISKIEPFVSNLVGLDFTPNATLLDPRERDVRECAVKVLNKGIQILSGGAKDSIIGHLDIHPSAHKIPDELRQLLETLFLYGITSDTYKSLQNTEIKSDAIPKELQINLFKIKDKLLHLKWNGRQAVLFQSEYLRKQIKELSKELKCFIAEDSVRSLMLNPACREIKRIDFTRHLSNLFSWNGVDMQETFPEFYDAYQKFRIPL